MRHGETQLRSIELKKKKAILILFQSLLYLGKKVVSVLKKVVSILH